jgi:hypothetical protein
LAPENVSHLDTGLAFLAGGWDADCSFWADNRAAIVIGGAVVLDVLGDADLGLWQPLTTFSR